MDQKIDTLNPKEEVVVTTPMAQSYNTPVTFYCKKRRYNIVKEVWCRQDQRDAICGMVKPRKELFPFLAAAIKDGFAL